MTKKPTVVYDTFQVVVVPFPFVDSHEVKRRPAVVLSSSLSFNSQSAACIMAMITSSTHTPWPCDLSITDLLSAGLPVESIIRMKLFTLDQRLILRQIGILGSQDQKNLMHTMKTLFAF